MLTDQEIHALVYDYIGATDDGMLIGFSYASHKEFYPRFCGLRIDVPAARQRFGSTKKAFIGILAELPPLDQVRVVEGVLKMHAPRDVKELTATQATARGRLQAAVQRMRVGPAVGRETLTTASRVVQEALRDADLLLREHKAANALDRVHTALHGYLKLLCKEAGLTTGEQDDATKLWGLLRKQSRQMAVAHPERGAVQNVLAGLGTIVGALGSVRDRTTLAHPNDLLETAEAAAAVDAATTVWNYLNRKFAVDLGDEAI